jgi:hypothetical protein
MPGRPEYGRAALWVSRLDCLVGLYGNRQVCLAYAAAEATDTDDSWAAKASEMASSRRTT